MVKFDTTQLSGSISPISSGQALPRQLDDTTTTTSTTDAALVARALASFHHSGTNDTDDTAGGASGTPFPAHCEAALVARNRNEHRN